MAGKGYTRRVTRPTADISILPISLGGTGSTTAAGALTNLGMVGKNKFDVAEGIAKVGQNGLLPSKYVPSNIGSIVASIEASGTFVAGKETTVDITDYNSFHGVYEIKVVGGSYRREDSRLIITPDLTSTSIEFIIDKMSYSYNVVSVGVNKPSIVGHRNLYAGSDVWAKASEFSTIGLNDTHESTSWEFCQNRTFAKDVLYYSSYMDTVNKNTIYMSLEVNGEMYVRVRHHSSSGAVSDWSDPYLVKTKDSSMAFTPMGIPEGETSLLSVTGRSLGEGHLAISGFGNVLISSMEAYDGVRDTELSIWRRMSTGWVEMTRIKASDYGFSPSSGWGERFDIHPEGKWFAVAAPYDGPGKVQILKIENSLVVPVTVLTTPMVSGGKFGWALRFMRNRLAVLEHDYNYVPGINATTIQRPGALYFYTFSATLGVEPIPRLVTPTKPYDFYRDIATGGYMPVISDLTNLRTDQYPDMARNQRVAIPGRMYYFNQGTVVTKNDNPWFELDNSSNSNVSETEYLVDRWTALITNGTGDLSSYRTEPRISSEPGVVSGGRIARYQAQPWVSPTLYYLSDFAELVDGTPGPIVAPYDGSFSAFSVHGIAGGESVAILYNENVRDNSGNFNQVTKCRLLSYPSRSADATISKNLVGSYAGHILAVGGKSSMLSNHSVHVFETTTPIDLDSTGWVPVPESSNSGSSTGGGSANNHGWWWCGSPNSPV